MKTYVVYGSPLSGKSTADMIFRYIPYRYAPNRWVVKYNIPIPDIANSKLEGLLKK